MGKYIVNNELTSDALMTTDLLKKCTLTVGSAVAANIKPDESLNKSEAQKRQYFSKYIEIAYPDGDKSASMIIPNCVMHHEIHDYYGKPSVYVGVPQVWVREMSLKLSATGNSPIFQDKKIISDAKYFWTRASFFNAETDKEFIRIYDGDGDDVFGGFADLFQEYPTDMLANITCSVKLKADTQFNEPLKGKEEWRVGFTFAMFTPFDSTEVSAPSTGISQRSIPGKADKIRPGLSKFKKVS